MNFFEYADTRDGIQTVARRTEAQHHRRDGYSLRPRGPSPDRHEDDCLASSLIGHFMPFVPGNPATA